MALKPCLGCGTPTRHSRCARCQHTRNHGQGNTTARGYGADHQHRAAALRAEHNPCALCHRPIDYTLPATSRWSFNAHHVRQDKAGPLVASHRICNEKAGQPLF